MPGLASAGLCWTVPREGDAAGRLLRAADVLRYRAKAEARDRAQPAPYVDDRTAPAVAMDVSARAAMMPDRRYTARP
jgi:hypothetical protein